MAKRFTDQNKWDDPWFDELPLKYKMAWVYLCDKCDIAGFWKPSMRNMCHSLGEIFTLDDLYTAMNGRLVKCGDKFLIPSFVRFQNGTLRPTNNCHLSIIDILKSNGYDENIQPLMSPSGAPLEGPCNGNGNGNGNVIPRLEGYAEGMQGEKIDEVVASCGIPKWAGQYGAVPNGLRRANTDGIAIDKGKIIIGIKNYAKKILAEKTESKFISDIDNWLATGQWLKYQTMPDVKTEEPQKEDDFMKKWNAQKALYNR